MKLRILSLLALLGVLSFVAAAADVSGTYKAEVPGRNGNTQTLTITLKADGATLTGTVANARGELPIADGKVDGNTVTFSQKMQMQGNEMTMKYTGKVEGDSIKFVRSVTTPNGERTMPEFTAKKQ